MFAVTYLIIACFTRETVLRMYLYTVYTRFTNIIKIMQTDRLNRPGCTNHHCFPFSRLTIKSTCPMHLQKYPLDTQTCPLMIGSCESFFYPHANSSMNFIMRNNFRIFINRLIVLSADFISELNC